MQESHNKIPKSKPAPATLRLVAEKPPERLQLSGLEPAADMAPGEYLAQCVSAALQKWKNRVALEFTIIEGPHTGTAVPEYIPNVYGRIQPRSRYAKDCAAALGRELSAADNLDPASVFKDKIFWVEVGWRKSLHPGGGKNSDDYALRCKDAEDFLRVHRVIRPGELGEVR